MSADGPASPRDGRGETPLQRSDRNWSELLQELRVLQTGTQIMAGFMLTLPFQARFAELEPFDHGVYLALVVLAVLITLLALTPVTMHRLFFGRRAKPALVRVTNAILLVCLASAGLLFVGVVLFVFDFVVSPPVGLVAAGVVAVLVLTVWLGTPAVVRRVNRRFDRDGRPED